MVYDDDPLGRTGFYVRRFKIQGSREHPVIVEEYTMDHGLLREMKKLRKDAAIAAGNWREEPKDANYVSYEDYVKELDARMDPGRRFRRRVAGV